MEEEAKDTVVVAVALMKLSVQEMEVEVADAMSCIIERNFKAIVTGEKGQSASRKKLYHKGSPFHRIVSGFMIREGDIIHGDGKGYESQYMVELLRMTSSS
ncbi:hypothetical protein MLD38_031282 [Melastoma candidum]|uniref:Uncharacterized protein n=1 Tax=Melastoma candidum TaxID=119954 RepID=A0ACB9MSR7_9MYRT|nr:hypothetical protein MLD38_031282 [Melastoma candidum]